MNTENGRKIKEVKGKTNNPRQQTKKAVEDNVGSTATLETLRLRKKT